MNNEHPILNRAPRTTVLAAAWILVAVSAFAQEYPPNYRDIPCPDTGQKLYQTSPDFFNLPYFQQSGPKHYAARCYYESGLMTGIWSDDFAGKDNICNWPRWKGRLLGDRYNLVEIPDSADPVFGFAYDINAGRKKIHIIEVFKDGPAKAAGLKPGDEIVEIDGLSTAKLSLDDLNKLLQSKDERTFKVHDPQKMIYKDLTIKKGIVSPGMKRFDLYSPIYFAEVVYAYEIRKGYEQEDREFWHAKALEFLQKFENQSVVCVDLDVSEKGPVAE